MRPRPLSLIYGVCDMTYILNYENKKYNLANYTQKTAFMFNNLFNMYNKAEDFKEKYTNACSACVVALGIDVVKGIFKDEENLDVNDVFILVEEIAAVYNKPLKDYKYKDLKEKVGKLIENINVPDKNNVKLATKND